MRHGQLVRRVVEQRDGHQVTPPAQVRRRQFRERAGQGVEGVEVAAGLPGRADRRVERVHERVHVGAGQVVFLVPGGGGQDDVGVQRGGGHPEVQRQQQVELALGCVGAPGDVARTLALGRFGGPDRAGRAEQVLEEVLVALARGAEQVRPPHGQDPRVVLRGVRVLGGEPQPPGGELPGHERAGSSPDASSASARSRGFQLKVGYDGIQPSRADWASRSAVAIPANLPWPAGEANVPAPNVS